MNLKFYPNDYPVDVAAIEIDDFESAITSISRQSTDTALQDVHTRRSLGQGSILNQNILLEAINAFLPSISVGAQAIPRAPFGGTLAFIAGGYGHSSVINPSAAFSFESETVYPADLRLSEQRSYMATLDSPAVGVIAGGRGAAGISATIDLVDFSKPSMLRSGNTLATPLWALAGVGNRTTGLFLGGGDSGYNARRIGTSYNHSNGAMVDTAQMLTTARTAPHNGLSGPVEGVILGGSGMNPNAWLDVPLLSIEAVNLSTFVVTAGGNALTFAHTAHGSFSNRLFGYVCAGMGTQATSYSDLVTKYTHTTRTTVELGTRLPSSRVCTDGTGSGKAGYLMGGDTAATSWQGSKTIIKLEYLTERISTLGTQLSTNSADQGITSDFNP